MKNLSQTINENQKLNEKADLEKEYNDVFRALLSKYEVKSPAYLYDSEKVKFFNEISTFYKKGKGATEKGDALVKDHN